MAATDSAYGPTWYAATMVPARERGPLLFDLDVDVCVVGGGLAGLTIAREVARRGWSVAVLEAKRVAWNASGRNGGLVAPGFAERPDRIVERVGFDRAKQLWALSAAGVDYVRTTIRATAMPGTDPVDGWLYVQRVDDEARMAALAQLITAFGTEAEIWPIEQVRAALKSPIYYQGLQLRSGFHIHPLNYALGLAAAAEQAGATIFERTPVTVMDPHGVRKWIDTPSARVRASHIVLAGSAHLSPLFPLVSEAVLPVATYVATTGPIERLGEAIAYAGAVADTRRAGDYYRIIEGNRLMWGGRISSRLSAPHGLKRLMRRDIRRVYPQLGKVEITHAWTGTMGYAVHKMPQLGEVSPGLWVATAFGGHGLNTTAMAGDLIARAIVEGDDRWRLFSSYDLVWTGRRLGRAVAQVLYWSMRIGDAVDERLAQRRAAARRRAAQRAVKEAERQAAAARRAADAAARKAAEEAARIAAEAAAQRAAEAAEWRAAEAASQLAAEAAGRLAAEARAADERAQRRAAEDAARLVAEAAERLAAEQARLAAEKAEREAVNTATRLVQEATERLAEQLRRASEEGDHRAAQAQRGADPPHADRELAMAEPSAIGPTATAEAMSPDQGVLGDQQSEAVKPKRRRRRTAKAAS